MHSWIELTEDNLFAVSLYKSLLPPIQFDEKSIQLIDGIEAECYARVAVPFIEPFQETIFPKNYVRMNKETFCLEIFEEFPEENEPREEIVVGGKLRTIITDLVNELVDGYRAAFAEDYAGVENTIELPDDEF